jgi:hypothetical protein
MAEVIHTLDWIQNWNCNSAIHSAYNHEYIVNLVCVCVCVCVCMCVWYIYIYIMCSLCRDWSVTNQTLLGMTYDIHYLQNSSVCVVWLEIQHADSLLCTISTCTDCDRITFYAIIPWLWSASELYRPTGEVNANFCRPWGLAWSAWQTPMAVISISRPNPRRFLWINSSVVLMRLSRPRSRLTTAQKTWQHRELNPDLWICRQEPWPLDHRGGLHFTQCNLKVLHCCHNCNH